MFEGPDLMILFFRIFCLIGLTLSAWWMGRTAGSPESVSAFCIALLACAAGWLSVFNEAQNSPYVAPNDTPPNNVSLKNATQPALKETALLAALSEPVFILDNNLRIQTSNIAAQRLLGKLLPGDPIDLYLRLPIAIEAMRESVAYQRLVERDIMLSTPMDSYFVLRSNPIPADSSASLTALFITLHDVTQLKISDRMRADFVANASHELRTPLATLIGFIETLQGAAADNTSTRHKFLNIMSSEAARMARLIDDLLSLSKIEMDKHVKPEIKLNIVPIIREVSGTLSMQFDADSRFIKLDMPDTLPHIYGDRDQLLQVFHNLLSNALKYGRSGTAITVAATLENNYLRIMIEDNGDGIANEHLSRLTERFYRVDTARSRNMGGTGLGLAIVKHIVERHRGNLQITSTLGKGTQISFTLPIVM
jgi:two-component system, OmpR family, phosphate regulon sensor histidine kinase PhoR